MKRQITQWFFILTLLSSALLSPQVRPVAFHLVLGFILLGVLCLLLYSRDDFQCSFTEIALFLLVLTFCLSWFYTIHKYHTAIYLVSSITLFLYYLTAKRWLERNTLIAVAIVLPIIFSLLSLWQYSGGFNQVATLIEKANISAEVRQALINRINERRVMATFALPNSFAGYLILLLMLLTGFFLEAKKLKPLIFLSLVLVLGNLLMTRALGALISLGAIAFLLVLIRGRAILKHRFLCLVLILVVLFTLFEGFSRYSDGLVFNPGDSVFFRALNYRSAWAVFQDNLWLGTGAGSFGDIYQKYQLPQANIVRYPHNLPLQIAAEGGGAVLVFFLIFWGYFFGRGWQMSKETQLFLYLSGVIFFLHNLVDIDYNITSISILFWSVLALLLRRDETFRMRLPYKYSAAAAVVLIVFLSMINLRMYQAEITAKESRRDQGSQVELLEKSALFNPLKPDYQLDLGEIFLNRFLASNPKDTGLLKRAEQYFSQAVVLAPTVSHYHFRLGLTQGILRDKESARAELMLAIEYAPLNDEYKKILAEVEKIP